VRANWIAIGAFSGGLAALLGAFGAHALKAHVSEQDLEIWRTGVLYHALHSIALVLFGLFQERRRTSSLPGALFLSGIAVFGLTLYGIGLGGPRWLGAITPLGGSALIAGWVAFGVQALRSGKDSPGRSDS
jgi:uncharacterized membrane protein YgdD (TMEM256/DUF423 family)